MLGYITEKEAKALGFKYSGSYFKIPLWLGFKNGEYVVATKFYPMEFVMTLIHILEGLYYTIKNEDYDFKFTIKEEIK
jgi:hypothetical protein